MASNSRRVQRKPAWPTQPVEEPDPPLRAGLPSFSELTFGFSAAEDESARAPRLLTDGYLDAHEASTRLLLGHDFLVLGYKGSGKSAISQHLRLKSDEAPDLFVKNVYLADFPYEEFAQINRDMPDAHSRYPTIWAWLILLFIVDSMSEDMGSKNRIKTDFSKMTSQLQKMGMIPSQKAPILLRKTKSKKFSVGVKGFASAEVGDDDGVREFTLSPVVERMSEIVCDFESESDHIVIIDGLDDVLLGEPVQTAALAALVLAVSRLNRRFAQESACCKVLLLCRTDLFESLPLPNSNKIRQDAAVSLDWYQNIAHPERTELIRLSNMKCRVYLEEELSDVDIFHEDFPRRLHGRNLLLALLDNTRHTPRDWLSLLRYLQGFSVDRERLSDKQIKDGIRKYSIEYFLPEIRNELCGFVDQTTVALGLDLLTSFGRGQFHIAQLRDYCADDQRFVDFELERFLERLFECSALGNMRETEGWSKPYFTFKYRNRSASLNIREKVRIHHGLWKGLGLT